MNKCICQSHDIVVTQSLFPYKDSGREKFFIITGNNFTGRHIEEQDLGEGEANGRKKRVNTNTDTEISYTNKQKDDLGCF